MRLPRYSGVNNRLPNNLLFEVGTEDFANWSANRQANFLQKILFQIEDPQNEVLSEKGSAWPLVRESLQENNTIENMERIFKAAKAHGFLLRTFRPLESKDENSSFLLLINFHELSSKDGIYRLLLPGSSGNDNPQKE